MARASAGPKDRKDRIDRPERPGRGRKLGEQLAERVEEEIIASGWPVGKVLGSEAELIERYGVSRAVFREAMRIVDHHGVAEMRRGPGGGLVVVAPKADAAVLFRMICYLSRQTLACQGWSLPRRPWPCLPVGGPDRTGASPMALYDAFISYSHAKDKPIASALQSAMQRLGKPWYRRRVLRLFRDDTSLSATPGLWPSIEQALANPVSSSCSPRREAAASPWVAKEVACWLEHKAPTRC